MRIGIFTECYKPVMNGVAVSIESFKNALEEKGHEVFIFAPENPKAASEHHVYRFPSISDKSGRLYPIIFPSIEIQKTYLPEDIVSKLDIIHAQHMFTAGRLARYVAKKYDKPLVYTYHTLIAEYTHYVGIFSPIVRLYLINMSKRFCNSCDQIITPSNPMKKILKSYGITTPIEVIMTGIEPKNYKKIDNRALKKELKIESDVKILLYLSRIAKEKNLEFLFRSYKKIRKSYPSCHLLMVGGGPEEDWCKDRIKNLGLSKYITMTGMVPKEEANRYFGQADIFVFPSVSETQGIVIAEAMASGTPPVAVGKMGPLDLIQNGKDGYLTKQTVNDFSEKVLDLLNNDKKCEQFAHHGLLRIDEFSNDTSVKKLIKLYKELHKSIKIVD